MNWIDQFHKKVIANFWFWLFYLFCRLSLSYAFIVAGFVKIFGERFASGLSVLHPMGSYLEALHHTGYYYTFIGYGQVLAALLLLIPRTVFIGALLYLPIIVNICILSLAVRFEGSLVTSPLMVCANSFILFWHWEKIKGFFQYRKTTAIKGMSKKFPWLFALFVLAVVISVIAFYQYGFELVPRNSEPDCLKQFGTQATTLEQQFCRCIHQDGKDLNHCLNEFYSNKAAR